MFLPILPLGPRTLFTAGKRFSHQKQPVHRSPLGAVRPNVGDTTPFPHPSQGQTQSPWKESSLAEGAVQDSGWKPLQGAPPTPGGQTCHSPGPDLPGPPRCCPAWRHHLVLSCVFMAPAAPSPCLPEERGSACYSYQTPRATSCLREKQPSVPRLVRRHKGDEAQGPHLTAGDDHVPQSPPRKLGL